MNLSNMVIPVIIQKKSIKFLFYFIYIFLNYHFYFRGSSEDGSTSKTSKRLKKSKTHYRLKLLKRNYYIEEGCDGSVYNVLEESDD